jgi:hypothetical protein
MPAIRAAVLAMALLAVAGCGGGDLPVDTLAPAATSVAEAKAAATESPTAASPPSSRPAVALTVRRQPDDAQAREGGVVQFSVEADGLRGITYQWQRDDEPIAGAVGSILQLTVERGDHLARYSVLASAEGVSVRSRAALLRVLGP